MKLFVIEFLNGDCWEEFAFCEGTYREALQEYPSENQWDWDMHDMAGFTKNDGEPIPSTEILGVWRIRRVKTRDEAICIAEFDLERRELAKKPGIEWV